MGVLSYSTVAMRTNSSLISWLARNLLRRPDCAQIQSPPALLLPPKHCVEGCEASPSQRLLSVCKKSSGNNGARELAAGAGGTELEPTPNSAATDHSGHLRSTGESWAATPGQLANMTCQFPEKQGMHSCTHPQSLLPKRLRQENCFSSKVQDLLSMVAHAVKLRPA